MRVDLFEKIKNGEIVCTDGFQVEVIHRGTDDVDRYDTYISLLDMISDGHIEGKESDRGCLGPNYRDLKATKSGLKTYCFWKTPIDQIGKPTFLEACRNGVLGTLAGRTVWWLIATSVLILIPTFSNDARALLKSFLNWLLELL